MHPDPAPGLFRAGDAAPQGGYAPDPILQLKMARTRQRDRRIIIACVAAVFILGMLTSKPQPAPRVEIVGQVVGGGLGALLLSFGLAALVLGWSRSGRRKIPKLAAVVCVILVSGDLIRRDGPDPRLAAMQQWADSLGTGQIPANDPPPKDHLARLDWAARNSREDISVYARNRNRALDIDPRSPPPEWATAAYLADAGKYPHVRDYFVRYRQLLQELDTVQGPLAERHLNLRLMQAGFAGPAVDELMDSIRVGMDESTRDVRVANADAFAYADRILALHDFLVRVDSRVHLNRREGTAEFDVDAELLQMQALVKDADRLRRVLESQQVPP